MGWSTGSAIMERLIKNLKNTAPKERYKIYHELIEEFQNFDCDTLDDCLGEDSQFDKAYYKINGRDTE